MPRESLKKNNRTPVVTHRGILLHIFKLQFMGLTALCERPSPRIYEGGGRSASEAGGEHKKFNSPSHNCLKSAIMPAPSSKRGLGLRP